MILRRFYEDDLAQASYLIGCAATGDALIVDANRDVEQYVRAAERERLRITHVTETHVHADYVSGSRELAARTGARLYLSDEGGQDWRYRFAEETGAELLRDGGRFMVGNIRIDVWHTPGHTPEHLSFLVTDTAGADRPMGIITGDFVFVGDVGRPDLLEKAAGVGGTMETGARQLFRSLQRFRILPDYVQVWPGHGAGSACGKALGAVPQSTVGYEKLFNPALSVEDEADFVEWILAGQPEPPRYFAEMKRINRDGPPILGGIRTPERLAGDRLPELLRSGALVVDLRPAAEYASRHAPGTIDIPLNRSFTTWAGWLVPYDRDVHLLVDEARCPGCVDEAVRDLAMIGLDRVAGWLGADALDAWERTGGEPGTVAAIDVDELSELMRRDGPAVIDVRAPDEWEAGRIPGGRNIPLGHLAERAGEVPPDRPVVVHCDTGSRSAIAASVLESKGFRRVSNLEGGMSAWRARGHPVERDGNSEGQ